MVRLPTPLRAAHVATVAVLAVALHARPLHAQPACTAGTLADYLALGPAGCLTAGVRFSDFALAASSGPIRDVRLTPTAGLGGPPGSPLGVGFDVTLAPPLAVIATAANPAVLGELAFSFHAAGPGSTSQILGLAVPEVTGAFVPTPPAEGNYVGVLASAFDPLAGGVAAGFCINVDCMGTLPIGAFEAAPLPTSIDVFLAAELGAELPPGVAGPWRTELSAFQTLVVLQTPEPAAGALLGVGLLALGAVGRRRRD